MLVGMQLVISVGILILRLMQLLLCSFWVMCIVICLWVSILVFFGVQGVLFNMFFELFDDQLVDIDFWSMDGGGGQFVWWYNFFYFYYCNVFGGGYQWVEILCGVVIDYVVVLVGFLVFDQCEIVVDCFFKDVVLVVELVYFFVFGDWGVIFGGGVKVGDVSVVGVDFFCQCFLWGEFYCQFVVEYQLFKQCVFFDVRGYYFVDLV